MKRLNWGHLPIVAAFIFIALITIAIFALFKTQLQTNYNRDNTIYDTSDPLITKVQNGAVINKPTISSNAPSKGPNDAPVTIVVFSDFACPYCKILSDNLKIALENNSNVKLVWKDFPISTLHPQSGNAHIAAECANEQGKFWEYHDLLFANQNDFSRDTLIKHAQQINLKMTDFSDCLNSSQPIEKITEDINEGLALNIDGTPYLFVNDQRVPDLVTVNELQQLIELHTKLNE